MSRGVVLKRTATLAADRDAATAARKLSVGNALRDKFDAAGMISKSHSFGHCPRPLTGSVRLSVSGNRNGASGGRACTADPLLVTARNRNAALARGLKT